VLPTTTRWRERSVSAHTNFEAFPPSAKKNILWWISSAKRLETRAKRIEETVSKRSNDCHGWTAAYDGHFSASSVASKLSEVSKSRVASRRRKMALQRLSAARARAFPLRVASTCANAS